MRSIAHSVFAAMIGAVLLGACVLDKGGLADEPKDAAVPEGLMDSPFADGLGVDPGSGDEGGFHEAAASTDGTDDRGSTLAPGDTVVGADARNGGMDAAHGDASDATNIDASDATNADAGQGETGTDGAACVLVAGGTQCCGAMTCTDHGGSCAAPGFCDQCAVTCTSAAKPICCALSGQVVTCEKRPIDC